jgi:hypothetical protein
VSGDNGSRAPLWGGRIGARMADLLQRTVLSAKMESAPHTASLAATILDEFFALVSNEIRGTVGPFYGQLADHPDSPDWVKNTFNFAARGTGQWQTFLVGSATGAAMSSGLGLLLQNTLNKPVRAIVAGEPNIQLSPETAAQAAARGADDLINARVEAAYSGIDESRYRTLVALNTQYPTYEATAALLNRGLITASHAEFLMSRNGFDANNRAPMLELRHQLLSPADLATLVNFGVMTEAEATPIANRGGVSTEDFRRLVLGGGQPPALQEVLLAWRRGIIDESKVDRAIQQSPIRLEWKDVVKGLQWEPLPVSEAANAVNQGHMSLPEAQRAARENGFKPDDFQVIIDNAGIPPGPQEALDWVNAGYITEAEFRTIFLESRIKNKYIDLYLKSRAYILPPDTIRLLYSRGALTREQATAKLIQRGLSTEDAAAYINGAASKAAGSTKDLTKSEIINLYQVRALTREQAGGALTDLGYDPDEAEALLELADLARVRTFQNAALTRVHSAYVGGRISSADASNQMDALAVAPEQRDDLLNLWDIEKTTYSKTLTPAQIVSAAKKDLLSFADAVNRLTAQGYSPDDAGLLLNISGVGAEG